MVTLEAAGGPPQSPQLPLTPHIPEQSWKEPPPPFLRLIFTQSCGFSENTGPSTSMYGITYSPLADTNDAANVTTMDHITLKPLSSTPPASIQPPFSPNLAGTICGRNLSLTATNSTKRLTDSQAPSGSTSTTHTHYTQTPNPTKTTEKETNASLHINKHSHTTTTTTQLHPSSIMRNQEDEQSTTIKPRRPLIVRVIRKSHNNAKQIHSPTQSATTPITHSMPTSVLDAGPGSKTEQSRPRRTVRIRRNISPDQPQMHPGSPTPRVDHLNTHNSGNSITPSTPSGNPMCSTGGQRHDRRRIVLVRRKGEPTYSNIRQQQQNTIPTDRHPPSCVRLSTVPPSNTLPTLTTTSVPYQVNPIVQMIKTHSSSLTFSDNPNSISSDTTPNTNAASTLDSVDTGNFFDERMQQQQRCILATLTDLRQNLVLAQQAFKTQLQSLLAHYNIVKMEEIMPVFKPP